MASVPPAPPFETQPKPLSFPARIIGVLFSPGETFADIVRRPTFIAPMILLALLTLGTQVLVIQRVGLEQIVRTQMDKNPRTAQMTADQKEQAIPTGVKVAKVFMYMTPIFSIAFFLAVAGIFLGIANFILAAEVRYKTMLAVTCYAFMPGIVNAILVGVTLFLKDPADIDLQNMVASNLGFLVDGEAHKALHSLAASMDIFSFWQLALLGIGIAAAARFSFKKGLAVVATPWLLWVLGKTAVAAIF